MSLANLEPEHVGLSSKQESWFNRGIGAVALLTALTGSLAMCTIVPNNIKKIEKTSLVPSKPSKGITLQLSGKITNLPPIENYPELSQFLGYGLSENSSLIEVKGEVVQEVDNRINFLKNFGLEIGIKITSPEVQYPEKINLITELGRTEQEIRFLKEIKKTLSETKIGELKDIDRLLADYNKPFPQEPTHNNTSTAQKRLTFM